MAKHSPTTDNQAQEVRTCDLPPRGPEDSLAGGQPRSGFRLLGNRMLARVGETPRQASLLFSAQMGSTAAGFLVATLQMHWMEPGEIGRYAFCLTLIVIGGLLFATPTTLLVVPWLFAKLRG